MFQYASGGKLSSKYFGNWFVIGVVVGSLRSYLKLRPLLLILKVLSLSVFISPVLY